MFKCEETRIMFQSRVNVMEKGGVREDRSWEEKKSNHGSGNINT